jgi:hypothetical protein
LKTVKPLIYLQILDTGHEAGRWVDIGIGWKKLGRSMNVGSIGATFCRLDNMRMVQKI